MDISYKALVEELMKCPPKVTLELYDYLLEEREASLTKNRSRSSGDEESHKS